MFTTSSETFSTAISAPTAFAGGTTNARGDDCGTSDPLTLFTVTGTVEVKVIGVCTVDLASAGGGTVSVGTAVNNAGIIASTTATAIDASEIWHDATPDSSVEATSGAASWAGKIVTQDIKEYIGTADVTAGQFYYICQWRPLSIGGAVVSSYPVST